MRSLTNVSCGEGNFWHNIRRITKKVIGNTLEKLLKLLKLSKTLYILYKKKNIKVYRNKANYG